MSLIGFLDQLELTHFFLNKLGGRKLLAWFLKKRPLVRRTQGAGLVYRVTVPETLALADELFNRRLYAPAIGKDVQTLIDLGCNVGFFTMLVIDHTGNRDLTGLAVDANPAMVRETLWHMNRNRVRGVDVAPGFAAPPGETGEREFHVNTSNLMSSGTPVNEPVHGRNWQWRSIRVPVLDVAAEWRKRHQGRRVDLLKIDIEGAEKEFLGPDNDFLQQVDTIVLEWHNWVVAFDEVNRMLQRHGFVCQGILEKLETRGVAWYVNQTTKGKME